LAGAILYDGWLEAADLARVYQAWSVILSEAKNLAVGWPVTEILHRGGAAPQNDTLGVL
jgi:hypothetical protein